MSICNSGRIEIEIDPETKSRIYSALKWKDLTPKGWFLFHAAAELERYGQMEFKLGSAAAPTAKEEMGRG